MRKYQFYSTGDDGDRDVYGANWRAQTFTPEITHLISKVKLKLFRVGSPGLITVVIKATSYGKPTGGNLCSGTLSGDDITDDTGGEWLEISLGDGHQLTKGTQYALIIKALDGDDENYLSIRADVAESTYEGGTDCGTTDSGATWDTYSGTDLMFEEWGVGPPSATTVTWGDLAKSQISAEKIEKAIERMIQAHEDDPDAHIEPGESLYSHKISVIIDHTVESVIADKIRDGVISIVKLEDFARARISPSLESLDTWTYSAEVSLDFSQMELLANTGTTANVYSYSKGGFKMQWSKPFIMQCLFTTYPTDDKEVYVISGYIDTVAGYNQNIGWKVVDGTLYALHTKSVGEVDTEYTTEITGVTLSDRNLFRVEYIPEESIKFYVNNVLAATHTENLPTIAAASSPFFYFRILTDAAANKWLKVHELYFSQDL